MAFIYIKNIDRIDILISLQSELDLNKKDFTQELVKVEDVLNLLDNFKMNLFENKLENSLASSDPITSKLKELCTDIHSIVESQNSFNSKGLLNALLTKSTAIIACVNKDLVYQYVNQAYENWFDIKSIDLIGKSVMYILGDEGYRKLKPFIDRALLGETLSFEMEVPYSRGGKKFVNTNYIPDIDSLGVFQGMFVISYDLTLQEAALQSVARNDKEIIKIMDSVPEMIGQWDKNLLNVHANHAYADYFNTEPSHLKGIHVRKVIGDVLFEQNLPFMLKALEGIPQKFERDILLPNGSIKNTLSCYIPNIINGVVEGFFVSIADITEIKEKNRIISKQKEFFTDILNSMHEGFAVLDKDAKFLYFNNSAAQLLGFTKDQLLGKAPLDSAWTAFKADESPFLHHEHPAVQTIKTGLAQTDVIMGVKNLSGEIRWLNVNSIPFFSEFENQKSSVLVTFNNVSTQFQKDKLMMGLIQNSPGMIYQFKLTSDGVMSFPFASPKAYDIYEISSEEVSRDSSIMVSMVIDEDRNDLMDTIIQSSKTLNPFEWKGRMLSKSGKLKWISAKSIPHKEYDGSILWDGILMDITFEMQLQEDLALERTKAAHASKLASLREMSAGVAHEINNPLAIIMGTNNLLKHHLNDPEKFNEKIKVINHAVKRISKIVNGLKRFSRLESENSKGLIQLSSILSNLNTYFEIKSRQDFVELKFDIQSEALINCDPLEIEQVFINVINNAIDAVKDCSERWIKVLIFDEENEVVIRIIDSGPGINDSVAAKLFDPFFTTKKLVKVLDLD